MSRRAGAGGGGCDRLPIMQCGGLGNRAGEGRDPWDGGTELRKELLCSHLNRGRCWREGWRGGGEVGQRGGGAPRVYSTFILFTLERPPPPPPLTSALFARPRLNLLRAVRSPAGISFLSPRSINLKKTIMLHQSAASFSPRGTFLHQVITW